MPGTNFIPAKEGALILWLDNFKAKLPNYTTQLNLLPADLSEITGNIDDVKHSIDDANLAKQTLKLKEAAKREEKKMVIDYLRVKIARFKTEAGYTEAIGRDLGIVGLPDNIDADNYKPSIIAKVFPQYIEISFVKKGIDAVDIYKRIQGETEWKYLARDTRSPYHDTTALAKAGVAEIREYMAIGLLGDDHIGLESDVVTVTYGGAVQGG